MACKCKLTAATTCAITPLPYNLNAIDHSHKHTKHTSTMFSAIIVLFCFLAVAFAGTPSSKSVTASVKDTVVDGIDGLNVKIAAPFKFQEYVVGFKYALGDLKRAPESLFAKRSWDSDAGTLTVDTDYSIDSSVLSVAADWNSDNLGMSLSAAADSKDKLKSIGFEKETTLGGNKFTVRGAYDMLCKKLSGSTNYDVQDTNLQINYDNDSKDLVVQIARDLDDKNTVSPSVSLKTGDISYGFTRKWDGGSLKSRLFPGDKVELEWVDKGTSGSWTTSAEVPLENKANTKVSFARDWDY